jgi:hypothetical protein
MEFPLLKEIEAIRLYAARNDHTILIDDRRCFEPLFHMPESVIKSKLLQINGDYKFRTEHSNCPNDILVAYLE